MGHQDLIAGGQWDFPTAATCVGCRCFATISSGDGVDGENRRFGDALDTMLTRFADARPYLLGTWELVARRTVRFDLTRERPTRSRLVGRRDARRRSSGRGPTRAVPVRSRSCGLAYSPLTTAPAPTPAAAVRVARHAAEAGFDSVWTGEHLALPSPQPRGFALAPTLPFLDTIVSLTLVATHTASITVASGVVDLPLHHPVTLAKQLASIDHVACERGMAHRRRRRSASRGESARDPERTLTEVERDG